MIVLTLTSVVILFQLQGSKSDTAELNVDWEEANERCKSQNDSLVSIQDVRNHSLVVGHFPIWSSVKGTFTPWIGYRGCFEGVLCERKCHHLDNNTVGNCYLQCNSKNYDDGGCNDTDQFYFGLQGNTCLCLCTVNKLKLILNSSSCNTLCVHSINNGECGGDRYVSVYQEMNVSLPEAPLGGFCLTCQTQFIAGRKLYSTECNATAYGYCVMSNGNGNRKTNMSTFGAYWERCRKQNLYIVGDTMNICYYSIRSSWTGLRKYKIDMVKVNRCYSIEIKEGTIGYIERNCTERHSFLCKQHIAQTDVYSTKQIKSTTKFVRLQFNLDISSTPNDQTRSPTTKRSTSTKTSVTFSTSWKSTSTDLATSHTKDTSSFKLDENKTTIIVGASIAGVVVGTSVVFLILCFIKRRKLQCLQSNQQQGKRPNVFDNSTYDDHIVKNQVERHVDIDTSTTPDYDNHESMDEKDGIYVEKEEEEYDHLHSSRQKHLTKDTKDNEYGTASYLEDNSYSTLRQGRNPNLEPDLENEYSTMPSLENNGSSVGNSEYDFCYQMNQRKDW